MKSRRTIAWKGAGRTIQKLRVRSKIRLGTKVQGISAKVPVDGGCDIEATLSEVGRQFGEGR